MVDKILKMNISDAEWEVMRIIWTLDEVKSSEIIDQLSEKMSWTESTIKTLIRRLVDKGLVKIKKEGRAYIYSATVSENEMMYQVTKDMFSHMCDMHKGSLLIRLIKEIPLSKSAIKEIQRELNIMEQSAPDTILCDCLHSKRNHQC
ncbi:CopY/TcrY family copper transport repressor [Lactobacillus jensenii]|uniref:CopY/TcrY family copper transport repressor n=1 Tax=Lactobacillus jensenii TaxID=109790 RepID=UPI001F095527|nr:CopY/TcrY family copper transport repressor [Lactobacillus jensenii]